MKVHNIALTFLLCRVYSIRNRRWILSSALAMYVPTSSCLEYIVYIWGQIQRWHNILKVLKKQYILVLYGL